MYRGLDYGGLNGLWLVWSLKKRDHSFSQIARSNGHKPNYYSRSWRLKMDGTQQEYDQLNRLAERYRTHEGDTQLELFPPDPEPRFPWVRYLAIAFLVAVGILAYFGRAQAEAPLRVKERELLNYIEQNLGYRTTGLSARYIYWPAERINQVFYGEQYANQDNILALHLDGTIILPDTFNLEQQSEILLHELVHFAAFENGAEFECRAAEERQAYELQIKYVEEVMDGDGILPDKLFVYLLYCSHL